MPSWFPGASLKRRARKWRLVVDNALQMTRDKMKGELVSVSRPSGFVLITDSPPLMLGFWNGRSVGCRKYDIKT
jgi:hypothetical protein